MRKSFVTAASWLALIVALVAALVCLPSLPDQIPTHWNAAGMIGGFLTAFVPAAASGFTTPNGPVYACLAMALSFLLCLVVSPLARKRGWKGSQPNQAFYAKEGETA